tara:strand:- start:186 stop:305 length:120 start_codon:yes stop_codon:yes gene_type:complete
MYVDLEPPAAKALMVKHVSHERLACGDVDPATIHRPCNR